MRSLHLQMKWGAFGLLVSILAMVQICIADDTSSAEFADKPNSCFLHTKSQFTITQMNPVVYNLHVYQNGQTEIHDSFYLNYTYKDLADSLFDTSYPTKIFVPGYQDEFIPNKSDLDMFRFFARSQKTSYNFLTISITAPTSSSVRNYPKTAAATRTLGSWLGKFLVDLSKVLNYDLGKVHLVGFSLGSHVSGFAGKYVQAESNQKIGKITGIDPAGPCFRSNGPADRLDRGDARYVEAIHSAGHRLGFGMTQRIGHRDIYANGGKSQPGCPMTDLSCHHIMAAMFYVKRHTDCQTVAYQCESEDDFNVGSCGACDDDQSQCTLAQFSMQSDVEEADSTNYLSASPSENELARKSKDYKGNYPSSMNKYFIKTSPVNQFYQFECLQHYQVKLLVGDKNLGSKFTIFFTDQSDPDLSQLPVKMKRYASNLYTGLLTYPGPVARFVTGEVMSTGDVSNASEIKVKLEFMSNMGIGAREYHSTVLCGDVVVSTGVIKLKLCYQQDQTGEEIKSVFKSVQKKSTTNPLAKLVKICTPSMGCAL